MVGREGEAGGDEEKENKSQAGWSDLALQRVPWTARRSNQSILKEINLNILWEDWSWSWSSNTLATWCEELTHEKNPDAGKDWGQEEKGATDDEVVGWHHRLDGHETEQALGDRGQGSLVCPSRGWQRAGRSRAAERPQREGESSGPQGGDLQLSQAQRFLRQTQPPGFMSPWGWDERPHRGLEEGRREDSRRQSHPLLLASFAEHQSSCPLTEKAAEAQRVAATCPRPHKSWARIWTWVVEFESWVPVLMQWLCDVWQTQALLLLTVANPSVALTLPRGWIPLWLSQ